MEKDSRVYVELTASTYTDDHLPVHACLWFIDHAPNCDTLRQFLQHYQEWDVSYVIKDLPPPVDPGRLYQTNQTKPY